MSRQTSLSVLVPAYNEQYLIETSLNRLRELGRSPLLDRVKVIVVDDSSTDATRTVLQRFQDSLSRDPEDPVEWVFLRHDRNRGKGAAIRTALEHADTELTVTHDADLEYHPRDLLKMIPLFLDDDADAVFGSRFLTAEFRRALFFRHELGNKLLTFICDLVCDLNLSDMETCYKMVRTRLLRSIPLESPDFRMEPELTIKLAKRGARIFEVPINYSGRTYQEGKKINWKDGYRALAAIAKFALSDRIYTDDASLGRVLARLRRARRLTQWTCDSLRPYLGNRVLELGAGLGTFTLNLIPRDVYWASDSNPIFLDELRHLARTRPYLQVSMTDVRAIDTFPKGQAFDTAVCINVLEHVEDDIGALRNISQALEDGARAVVLVPQGPGLYGTLDEIFGHHRRYTKQRLIRMALPGGFKVVRIIEIDRLGSLGWWLNGRVLRRRTLGLGQLKLFDALVPLLRRVDSWLPLPALSLIAVLEKLPPSAIADRP
jgi:glycosyltransferase involved in cell wall biosynthesis